MDFPSLGNSDYVVASVPIKLKTTCLFSSHSRVDWDGLRDHLRDVLWNDIFKLSASATASEFCEWVQIGIDVYIPHCKYQTKLHSSPCFSAAFATPMVRRNHFFHFFL